MLDVLSEMSSALKVDVALQGMHAYAVHDREQRREILHLQTAAPLNDVILTCAQAPSAAHPSAA